MARNRFIIEVRIIHLRSDNHTRIEDIEGIGNTEDLRLRTRNLLPWLDLWFGVPGTAARHLQAVQTGEVTVMVLGN
ncbi:MAG: hypothetical protein OXH90_02865 [Paracoccaceae bacterium]|nr:hypothetical protein [Paracoccaceae bacterium]MDE2916527.1 hypothetical protein [Paracoccaceae bacterium]